MQGSSGRNSMGFVRRGPNHTARPALLSGPTCPLCASAFVKKRTLSSIILSPRALPRSIAIQPSASPTICASDTRAILSAIATRAHAGSAPPGPKQTPANLDYGSFNSRTVWKTDLNSRTYDDTLPIDHLRQSGMSLKKRSARFFRRPGW